MALRWCAAGMLEADHQFRRVNGRLHLPKLRALVERFNKKASAGRHDETVTAA
jgi:putative transposase